MKIKIIAGLCVIALLAHWLLLYLPSKRLIKKLQNELHDIKIQISQIEDKVSFGGKMEKGIMLLDERFRMISSKFPEKEEEALAMLSILAKKHNIDLRSVKSQPKDYFFDEQSSKIQIDGKYCKKIYGFHGN